MAEQVHSEGRSERSAVRPLGAASPLRILKPGQGRYVRWGTAIGAGAIAVAGAAFVSDQLPLLPFGENMYVRTLVPVLVLLIAVYLIYYLVGRHPRVVDFMIATEGEMKKVNWSSRREVWGATKVVIVTVVALAIILFVVDVIFVIAFSGIGVLRINVIERLFGAGTT